MGVSYFIRKLVEDETDRRVASAGRHGGRLSISSSADQIARDFPGSTMSTQELRNQLFAQAARAGVRVRLGGKFAAR